MIMRDYCRAVVKNTLSILVILFLFSGLVLAHDRIKELLQAQECYEDGRYAEAATLLEKLCQQQPSLAEAHRLLGHTYYQLDRIDDARSEMVEAIANGRLTLDVLERLTQIDRTQNHTAALQSGLRLRLLMEPHDLAWRKFHADVLAASGANDEAERLYERIIEDEPSRPDTYMRLGNLYLRKEKAAKAVLAFEMAFHLGGSNLNLERTIAELWCQLGNLREALSWYERDTRRGEDSPGRSQLRLAELLAASEEFDRAERAARPLAESMDTGLASEAAILLGRIALQRGRIQEGVDYWESAVQSGTEDHQILAFLGSHYFNEKNYDKATLYLESRLSRDPQDKDLLRYLIISLIRSENRQQAKVKMRMYLEQFGLDEQAEKLLLSFI